MPMTMRDIIQVLQEQNAEIDNQMIRDLLVSHKRVAQEQHYLYKRFIQEDVPILKRQLPNTGLGPVKIDSKIPNNFMAKIVNTKVGYMGQSIHTELNKQFYDNDTLYDLHNQVIQAFETWNSTSDLNSETVKMAAIVGLAARLLWVNDLGRVGVMNVDPWECVFIYDRSIYELQYAMRYYQQTYITWLGGTREVKKRLRVEWYDREMVYFYVEDKNGNFILDPDEEPKEHLFQGVPLLPFPNNKEQMGDTNFVLDHIDAADTVLSDLVSELEQFRIAYLKLIKTGNLGMEDQDKRELLEEFKKSGILVLEEGDAQWLIKDLPISAIITTFDKLSELILQFSDSVDFGDSSFASGMPVLAYKLKLFGLETKCKTMENKMRRALFQQWKLITSYWREYQSIDIDPLSLAFVFNRADLDNVDSEIENLAKLGIPISRKTAWSTTSFISDPEEEARRVEQEALEEGQLMLLGDNSADTD